MIKVWNDLYKSKKKGNETFLEDCLIEADEKNNHTDEQYKLLTKIAYDGKVQYYLTLQHDNGGEIYHAEVEFSSYGLAKTMYDNIQSFYLDTVRND
ncbi:MAG: hypothetical protein ACE5GV_06005 [Candidatus Scalindua sp.]